MAIGSVSNEQRRPELTSSRKTEGLTPLPSEASALPSMGQDFGIVVRLMKIPHGPWATSGTASGSEKRRIVVASLCWSHCTWAYGFCSGKDGLSGNLQK